MFVVVAIVGIVAVVACGVVVAIGLRARAIRALGHRLEADALAHVSGAPPIVTPLVARHLRTVVDGRDACLVGFAPGLDGALTVTDGELLLDAPGPLHVPMGRILDAGYRPSFEGVVSDEGVILALTWQRGGERLTSLFLIQARRHEVEKLRREIHLRSGRPPGT